MTVKTKVIDKEVGCLLQKSGEESLDLSDVSTKWWNLVQFDKNQLGKCDRHSTAMFFAALASAFRATFEPAYCEILSAKETGHTCWSPKKLDWKRIQQMLRRNLTAMPLYDIFYTNDIFFPVKDSECGPKSIDEERYFKYVPLFDKQDDPSELENRNDWISIKYKYLHIIGMNFIVTFLLLCFSMFYLF